MRHSHYDAIGVNRAFTKPKFERFPQPKSVHPVERVKYPPIPQEDIITVQDQSRVIDRIRALEREKSTPRTGICPEPVTEVTIPQLKRLRLIPIVEVVNTFDRMWCLACEIPPAHENQNE
jgi:hypothetical protein